MEGGVVKYRQTFFRETRFPGFLLESRHGDWNLMAGFRRRIAVAIGVCRD
jgi:hypothetical protein